MARTLKHTIVSSSTAPAVVPEASPEAAVGAHPNEPSATEPDTLAATPMGDEKINSLVAGFQDTLGSWEFGPYDLASLIRKVRDWGTDLWAKFLPEVAGGEKIKQPNVLFCFHWDSPRNLGHYRRGRNAIGLRWEISLNPRHLSRRSEVELAETVLHELLHCYEDLTGTAPRSRNNYHSAWFRKTADHLGIPCTRHGATLGILDPSPFMEWARERGLDSNSPAPARGSAAPSTPLPKRRSWSCSCPEDQAVTVQVPRGSQLRARCILCGSLFELRGA